MNISINTRFASAILLPFLALAAQWLLWPWIAPFVWFLFFPAVFFSARLGGLWGGLISTVLSAGLVWYFFIPPMLSWSMDNRANLYSVGLFLIMGYLFSDSQERLRKAQQLTEAALAESNAAKEQITRLYEKTLELDELKNQFFANVSHELRTPLTLIMSPLARRLESPGLPATERREDEMMLRNARLLYRHVSDLLDASKLEAGRMTMDYARFDLGDLMRGIAAQFDSLAREKSLDYRLDVPAALTMEADGEKVQRIFLNLLSNAFKFTPASGCIQVRLREMGGQAVIEVRDNGPGVPADMREAIFERFRQVEGGAQRCHGGTGLGLTIVREFAELHGGSAAMTEAPGGGALFTIRLPLAAPDGTVIQDTVSRLDPVIDQAMLAGQQSAPPAPPDDAPAGSTSPLILVVEDNADMNAYLVETLRPQYRVATAFDGREGLDKAVALHPDLIVSDVMMPVMSGDQMVTELRGLPGMDTVPIIMLTAKADDDLRVRLYQQGIQSYLNKPFSTAELLARIGGIMASRLRSREELQRSETALTEAQRLAGIGNWEWDTRTDTHLWSEEVYRIYGRPLDLPPAAYPEVQQYFTPESWARLSAEVERGIAQGLPYECDAEVIRPNGEHRWITARGQAVRDAGNTVIKLYGTVQDITARKRAEDEIRHLNAELEQRVIKRTAELSAANKELDAFAYAVSHDLRAPLRAMNGFSQALLEDYGDGLEGEAKTYLDQIGSASKRMDALIDGILTLSRSTRNPLVCEPVDISAMAERLLRRMADYEPERRVRWQVETNLAVHGDARMVEVVMQNLLENAWKYTARTETAEIRVSSQTGNGQSWISVSDNGAGFDMAYAGKLFQPFQRLHRQEEFAGIGIGLATVQRIIHRHGGGIEAEGEVDNGARFRFFLDGRQTTDKEDT